ncbi:MAG: hypothetical protein JW763_02755 [candidate division Zixibacteria bacterium]|nr:hypothetical protein [candidate division Zixibacteria bacterium]
MRKLSPMTVGTVLLSICVLFLGCDDDIVESTNRPAYIDGFAYLSPGCVLYAEVRGQGGMDPGLDSVRMGDSLCYIDLFSYFSIADPVYTVHVIETEGDYMFASGDNAVITFYGENGTGTASLRILDLDLDAPVIVSPESGEILSPGEHPTIVWNRVDNAEWYAVYYYWQIDSLGLARGEHVFAYAFDTTYPIIGDYPDEYLNFINVLVCSCTGPNPGQAVGNIDGDYAVGKIVSYTNVAVVQLMGEGNMNINSQVRPNLSSQDIVRRVLERP